MTRRRVLAALLGLAVIAAAIALAVSGSSGPHPPAAPPAPAPSLEQFGANVNRLFNDGTYSPAQIDAQLAALRSTGATIARSDTLWETVEPTAPNGSVHHYNWRFDDLVAGSLARHGLRWLALLDYSAPWASEQPGLLHSHPRSASDFAGFASAFAARYGRGGVFWHAHTDLPDMPVQTYEVWNEPDNVEFWRPAPDASAYAELYLDTRTAIKLVDPAARVVIGGLTRPTMFLPQMLAAQPRLADSLDGVAIHPYGPTPGAVMTKIRSDRQVMATLGLGSVPLYVTEFGWTIHPVGALDFAPESRRPGYITTTLAALGHTNCSIAAVALYTWVTPERHPTDLEDWFGVSPPRGGSSPDREAFAAGVAEANKPGPRQPVCGSG